MSFNTTIEIPIQSYLKKMIARTNETDPFVLSIGKCHYSHVFYSSLGKNYIPVKSSMESKFNDTIRVKILSQVFSENKFFICKRTISQIDKVLSSMFDEKFNTYLGDNCQGKGDVQKYIIKFMENYNITEDDIKLETLRKKFYREREKTSPKDKKTFRAGAKTSNLPKKQAIQSEMNF